jgi:hypothetical protein
MTSQQLPAVQSVSEQHSVHAPSQQVCPSMHWASVWQPHTPALQVPEVGSQQVPAVQSASEQHSAHAPSQQVWPSPHCASLRQPQTAALHVPDAGSQQVPAVQSASEQHSAHAPSQQLCPWSHCASLVHAHVVGEHAWAAESQQLPAVQSASEQHSPHVPSQHTCPASHCASERQPQLAWVHVCDARSQHVPAVQSSSEQQTPTTHVRWFEGPEWTVVGARVAARARLGRGARIRGHLRRIRPARADRRGERDRGPEAGAVHCAGVGERWLDTRGRVELGRVVHRAATGWVARTGPVASPPSRSCMSRVTSWLLDDAVGPGARRGSQR